MNRSKNRIVCLCPDGTIDTIAAMHKVKKESNKECY